MNNYRKRVADEILKDNLEAAGLVLIEGIKWCGKIDMEKMSPPSFKMVLTGTGAYAYKRKDGIWVAPVSCLKP